MHLGYRATCVAHSAIADPLVFLSSLSFLPRRDRRHPILTHLHVPPSPLFLICDISFDIGIDLSRARLKYISGGIIGSYIRRKRFFSSCLSVPVAFFFFLFFFFSFLPTDRPRSVFEIDVLHITCSHSFTC